MFHKWFLLILLLSISGIYAQEIETPYKSKKITVSNDTIRLEKVSINKAFFKILDVNGVAIDTSNYKVDFQKGTLIFKDNFVSKDTLEVKYLKFPDYITKEYTIYDESKVVPNEAGMLYALKKDNKSLFKPFDGLNTSVVFLEV